jgi:hypothetical protein
MVLKPTPTATPTPTPTPPVFTTELVASIREALFGLPDHRKGGNNQRYAIGDAALSAFSVFFMQSPSFLDFQRRMQKERGANNANTLFGVHQIPCDQQIRNLLDPINPEQVFPVFIERIEALHEQGALTSHRGPHGGLLIALDGTQYYCSKTIHCPQCSTRTLSNGEVVYSHSAVTPVIVAPQQPRVFALPPAFVTPQDGHEKQDCELNASTRWLNAWGTRVRPWQPLYLGDDLYCHQPFCEQVLAQGGGFLFVCLPTSHSLLYEWIGDFERNGELNRRIKTRWTGTQRLQDTYRWINTIPLRDGDDALMVNWCELTVTNAKGEVLYHNAWATSETIDRENVVALVAAARSRWKIENENNNTLKTQGYHFEHNYGHGKQHLAALLATLILLAFLAHSILDHADTLYQRVRQQLPSRRTFFEHLRALTLYTVYASWEELLTFMLEALEPAQPPPKARRIRR